MLNGVNFASSFVDEWRLCFDYQAVISVKTAGETHQTTRENQIEVRLHALNCTPSNTLMRTSEQVQLCTKTRITTLQFHLMINGFVLVFLLFFKSHKLIKHLANTSLQTLVDFYCVWSNKETWRNRFNLLLHIKAFFRLGNFTLFAQIGIWRSRNRGCIKQFLCWRSDIYQFLFSGKTIPSKTQKELLRASKRRKKWVESKVEKFGKWESISKEVKGGKFRAKRSCILFPSLSFSFFFFSTCS